MNICFECLQFPLMSLRESNACDVSPSKLTTVVFVAMSTIGWAISRPSDVLSKHVIFPHRHETQEATTSLCIHCLVIISSQIEYRWLYLYVQDYTGHCSWLFWSHYCDYAPCLKITLPRRSSCYCCNIFPCHMRFPRGNLLADPMGDDHLSTVLILIHLMLGNTVVAKL